MKKPVGLLATLFIIRVALISQGIIENPERPLAKNAGRVLKLQEIWRITDEGGQFYFKYPGEMSLSSDGHLFLADENELLKFLPEGKFIGNLFKKGQGPGEIQSDFAYFIHDNEIPIYDFMTIKIIQTDLNGQLIESFYLGAGRILLKAQKDIIFVLEKDQAENYLLIKHKIME
jgi:hypothetical protein